MFMPNAEKLKMKQKAEKDWRKDKSFYRYYGSSCLGKSFPRL